MNEQQNTILTPNFIDENIDKWDDEECLQNFVKFLTRVRILSELVQNEEGAYIGKQVTLWCNERAISSEVLPLDWPLMQCPVPDTYTVN